MSDLEQIFYSLDKLCDKWEPYFPVYEKWFSKFRGKAPRILEIGVYKGGSAEMWIKYFGPGTKVVGVDINPECKQYATDDIEIVIGDTGDPIFWHSHGASLTGPFKEQFDIIIDDGGHHMKQQIVALENSFWCMLKDDGIFLTEDTHTSYWNHWSDSGYKNPTNFIEYTKNIIDSLHAYHTTHGPDGETFPGPEIKNSIVGNVYGIHYYDSMVVIEKGIKKPFRRVFSKENPATNVVPDIGNNNLQSEIPDGSMLSINTRR